MVDLALTTGQIPDGWIAEEVQRERMSMMTPAQSRRLPLKLPTAKKPMLSPDQYEYGQDEIDRAPAVTFQQFRRVAKYSSSELSIQY
jgi:hypothetical protein